MIVSFLNEMSTKALGIDAVFEADEKRETEVSGCLTVGVDGHHVWNEVQRLPSFENVSRNETCSTYITSFVKKWSVLYKMKQNALPKFRTRQLRLYEKVRPLSASKKYLRVPLKCLQWTMMLSLFLREWMAPSKTQCKYSAHLAPLMLLTSYSWLSGLLMENTTLPSLIDLFCKEKPLANWWGRFLSVSFRSMQNILKRFS